VRAVVLVPLLLLALPAAADTIVMKDGKKVEGTCLDPAGRDPIVLNPYHSRCPDMAYGITDKERIPRDKVAEVIVADPPLVHYREMAWQPEAWKPEVTSASFHMDLARFCETNKLAEERDRELKLALCFDPDHSEAMTAIGRTAWAAWSKGNPLAIKEIAAAEHEYVKLDKPAEIQAQWDVMTAMGTTRPRIYLERARRSAKFPLGRRDKVPLTVRSELSPGATYCVYLPKSYDPLVPTGLVVGLHGGGPGGRDQTLVTGSGESAMDFYMDVAEEQGVLVVCPTALASGWQDPKNEPLVDAVIEEMKILYNVDESRIWLTGHSMGGFGSWYWGPHRAELWAAFAPCAGGGGSAAAGKAAPVYIYHGTDDPICAVAPDREAADALRADKTKPDFVYTEIDKTGHGFPDWVRHDIFRFFAGRWKDDGKKRSVWPRSSFERKPGKDEIKCFGDPAAAPSVADSGDAKLSALIADLQKGGGRGVEASKELGERKDAATIGAVGHVLHSKKATTDARVLAAKTLGAIGAPECVKQLSPECSCEDFRVLDAVVESLARIGGKDTVEPLVKATKQFGVFWDKSGVGGQFVFTEYETRCESFARVCDAFSAVGDAAAALPVLEKEIVARVYTPKAPYTVPVDNRFTAIPPRARLTLMKALRACLAKLKDPRGKTLLAAIKTAWSREGALVQEADAGLAEIGG
jgi:hypothetical protein